jgi:hypothetical protein
VTDKKSAENPTQLRNSWTPLKLFLLYCGAGKFREVTTSKARKVSEKPRK